MAPLKPVVEYSYSYDKTITSPFKTNKNDKGEILLNAANVKPLAPKSFEDVKRTLARSPNNIRSSSSASSSHTTMQQKFIYTIRHGKSEHNFLSDHFTKPISWRFLAKLRDNFDPRLTNKGSWDATKAGDMLHKLVREDGAPRPVSVYTSPLRRCVETSMHAMFAMGLCAPGRSVVLHVKEGLREWKGYEHNHQSDRRRTAPEIRRLVKEVASRLGLAEGSIELRLDAELECADENNMRETYVDVDVRVRRVLDDIFDDEQSGKCVMLVLHNRSNKSVLRVMGHTQDEVELYNMDNAAVLGYLVGRTALDAKDVAARAKGETTQRGVDFDTAEEEKAERILRAKVEVEHYAASEEGKAKLRDLAQYLGERARDDVEAKRALKDLHKCVPDLSKLIGGPVRA